MEDELIVKGESGNIVARMSVRDGELNGQCRWFDGAGELVAVGFFKQGRPWSGTFLNWSSFLPGDEGSPTYSQQRHGRDWITLYESTFDSVAPDYQPIIEAYCKGKRICPLREARFIL